MKFLTFLAAAGAACFPIVSAHGFVRSVTIDGTKYAGPDLTSPDPNLQSPIRAINLVDPVKGTNNRALNCGQNAVAAAMVVPANPGSQVTFDWSNGEGGAWVHNFGVLMTYMAKCDGTCDQFDPINSDFFKIDQDGRNPTTGGWALDDLAAGKPFTLQLPTTLPAGDYLIRHEILALHLSESVGGAEFYPSCTQIRLAAPSNPSTAAIPSDTVKFPGGYSETDPGILYKDTFTPFAPYSFPGPNIDQALSGGSTRSPSTTPPFAAAPAAAAPASSSAAPCPGMVKRRTYSRLFRNVN